MAGAWIEVLSPAVKVKSSVLLLGCQLLRDLLNRWGICGWREPAGPDTVGPPRIEDGEVVVGPSPADFGVMYSGSLTAASLDPTGVK